MKGFDSEFTDIVDYILRITNRIWEGRQVHLCHEYYSADCPVYTLAGYTQGAEQVTQNTLNTLTAFPDRTLHADNIVWGGNAESGFHSSHLISSRMTNLGPSEYGPATGREATIRVIAHCVCKDNRIIEEWLVRDNYALVEQLGIDPHEWASQRAQTPLDRSGPFVRWLASETERVYEQCRDRADYPADASRDPEALVAAALQNIWTLQRVEDAELVYAEDAVMHVSARSDIVGTEAFKAFYTEILDQIPDARVCVDYVCSNAMLADACYVAARWTLAGTHSGGGPWGEPTGAPLLILGESQYRLVDGKVTEEWLVYDQLAVLTQVYRASHG